MKTITKFIFVFPVVALACGSTAFAQLPLEPLIPPDSAAKRAAHPRLGLGGGDKVTETLTFNSGSQWHLTVNADTKFGLVITGASFQKSRGSPFVYVLHDGRIGEIFVPYHSGSPNYRDISGFPPWGLLKLDPPAKFPQPPGVPENGAPVRQIIGVDKFICKEVRDYLAWMTSGGRVRYGQEVVYFSVLKAAYYSYIMEWTFRDDGTILVRAGSTGAKKDAQPLPGPSTPSEGHVHNFTWRLDIDLNGASANSAEWTSHSEGLTTPFAAKDNKELIKVEGSRVWNPEQFNTLEISDARLRNRNRSTSYELVPMRSGTARHYNPLFPWTKADFWVTRYRPSQIQAINGTPDQELPLPSLPDYITGESTVEKDLVIWYTGSEHHENDSRDEDRSTVAILWTGFELVPHNLFDDTPFFQ